MKTIRALSLALAMGTSLIASSAYAGAIHDASLFVGNTLPANDDNSTGLVNIGFTINFFGLTQDKLYVNNNGNVTFTQPLSVFTPFGLLNSSFPIIAPFFADVDTRGAGSGLMQYGTGNIGGRNAFGVNWINVGYFGAHVDKLNSFQLVMVDRSDTGAGNFDFEFNYDKIQWETGDASGGSGGLGGAPARVGYTNGDAADVEFVGSGRSGAFLDGGPNALIAGSLNSTVAGQYIFEVRNGTVVTVPEPSALALVGIALAGLALAPRQRSA